MKSWKTTAMGIITSLGAILTQAGALLDDDPATVFDINALWVAIAAMGLVFARDNDKSSEDVRA